MPLVMHRHLEPAGELGLWRIEEAEAWFRDRLFLYPPELRQLSHIKGRRRVEWLAVRHLVHHMSGREKRGAFVKDDFGKPHLEHSDWQISISHSHELAAAIAAPGPVGVDIQFLVAKIERIAHRYMRPEEMDSLRPGTRLEHLHVYWGAKEALYKAYGRRRLDFLVHILIDPFPYDPDTGRCYGRIVREDLTREYLIRYERLGDYMLVYCLENAGDT